jgi:hypothetical protein
MYLKNFVLFIFTIISLTSYSQKKDSKNLTHSDYNWAVGLNVGNFFIDGDVPAKKMQLNTGINIYKPFAKWFGLKLKYAFGNAKGMHWLYSENFAKNTAWASKYAAPTRTPNGTIVYGYNANGVFTPTTNPDRVYYNYKTTIHNISFSTQFTLPLPFEQPIVGIHLFVGGGALIYNAKVNALNGTNSYATLFNDIANSTHKSKKEVLNALEKGMDNTYETKAERTKSNINFTQNFGLGISYKFKNRFEVGLEKYVTFIKNDLLDGQRWQEHAYGDAVLSRDFDKVINNNITFSYYF